MFVITLNLWIERRPDLFPELEPTLRTELPTDPMKAIRVESSLRGEEISIMTVRRRGDNEHTVDYQQLLRDLGKPSSADRETYDCKATLDSDESKGSTKEGVLNGMT